MSVTQKMFAYGSLLLAVVLVFTQAVPVPVPEEVNPGIQSFIDFFIKNLFTFSNYIYIFHRKL